MASIQLLLSTLADNSVDVIVVANGRYKVSPSGDRRADSLWIGAAFAGRTRPVVVRAQTRGGVTFDGGGTGVFGCISFEEGAHHQTWDGFNCAGGHATQTGVVTFGGYAGSAAPHHIKMRFIKIEGSCTGSALTAASPTTDHAFYVSWAVGGPHDLQFEDITVDGSGFLASAFHFYHSNAKNKNGWNITVRRLHVTGTQEAIILADRTLRNIRFDDVDIRNAIQFAVIYYGDGPRKIVLSNVRSTGSGVQGFYQEGGAPMQGLTIINSSLH